MRNRKTSAAARGRGGPYPTATCHFCQSTSRIVPPSSSSSSSTTIIYDTPISHGNLDSWLCSACQCYNRTDAHEHGGLTSWEPAMSEPRMNTHSFARRGVPPPSALMLQERQQQQEAPFCHTCLTNQALLMNMLANYLPDEHDPTYPTALENLPSYRASLLTRYPPVCNDCTPAVQQRLYNANTLAKQEAMRHFLARSRVRSTEKGKGREVDGAIGLDGGAWMEGVWWARGGAWVATNVFAAFVPLLVISSWREDTIDLVTSSRTISLALASLFWTAWNPRWRALRKIRRRRSDVRIVGQRTWAQAHVILWLGRLLFLAFCWMETHAQHLSPLLNWMPDEDLSDSMFRWTCISFTSIQILIHIYAASALKLHYGPQINWRTDSQQQQQQQATSGTSSVKLPSSSLPSAAVKDDAFNAALNLRVSPPAVLSGRHVKAGGILSSGAATEGGGGGLDDLFKRNPAPVDDDDDDDDDDEEEEGGRNGRADAMDWSPTAELQPTTNDIPSTATRNAFAPWASASAAAAATSSSANPNASLGPQRFFVPEQPTGLEDLLLDGLRLRESVDGEGPGPADERGGRDGAGWASWWRR
ncbi:hypothetical protein CF327_g2445 [Tilletia walkeri]|nr:hypothetical protein CF327_g2445 [Tilletia walkeri]